VEPPELKRSFQATRQALLREVGHVDGDLATKLSGPLNEMTA
jgi:hypothetical protein